MGWSDRFWSAGNWVLDTTIHAVADTMNICGTLAATLGGVAYAVSNVLALKEVNASYFGGIHAVGNFDINIDTNIDVQFNDSLPLTYSNHLNDGTSYNLTDYVSASMVQSASYVFVASGVVLKTLGANINKWQHKREDRRNIEATNSVKMSCPSFKEYLYVSVEAFTGSLSTALLSHSISSWALYLTGNMLPYIAYPPNSANQVYGEYYNGPVISTPFSLHFDLAPSKYNFSLPFFNLIVDLNKTVDVIGNATYGGGFFFKKKIEVASPQVPYVTGELVSTSMGTIAYLLSNFFAKKNKELYDKRRLNDQEAPIDRHSEYKIIN